MFIGNKCTLRPLNYSDVKCLNQWNQDEQICKYLGSGFIPVSIDLQKKWMENMIDTSAFSNSKRYMIEVNKVAVGLVGLYNINWIHRVAEIGLYIGNQEVRRMGVATDAANLILNYAKRYLNLRKIKLFVVADNIAAFNLWRKIGFQQCGELREERFIDGKYINLIIMEMMLSDYKKQ